VHLFNGRTRALTALVTGLGSILGALFLGVLVDKLPFRRRMRSFIGLAVVVLLAIGIWGGGLALQIQFTRQSVPPVWDWTDKASVGPIILLGSCKYRSVLRRAGTMS
jgi:predicted MFS family arabinose efflux permease